MGLKSFRKNSRLRKVIAVFLCIAMVVSLLVVDMVFDSENVVETSAATLTIDQVQTMGTAAMNSLGVYYADSKWRVNYDTSNNTFNWKSDSDTRNLVTIDTDNANLSIDDTTSNAIGTKISVSSNDVEITEENVTDYTTTSNSESVSDYVFSGMLNVTNTSTTNTTNNGKETVVVLANDATDPTISKTTTTDYVTVSSSTSTTTSTTETTTETTTFYQATEKIVFEGQYIKYTVTNYLTVKEVVTDTTTNGKTTTTTTTTIAGRDNSTFEIEDVSGANEVPTLYYSVIEDDTLGSSYRNYYVSTADQLYELLCAYQDLSETYYNNGKTSGTIYYYNYYKRSNSTTSSVSTSTVDSATKVRKMNSSTDSALFEIDDADAQINTYKLGITLLCDLDFGGADGAQWGFSQTAMSTLLQIEGNNHTIYNGNFIYDSSYTNGCIVPDNKRVIAENLNVENSFLSLAEGKGLFGGTNTNCYYNNINFDSCVSAANRSYITFLIGNGYNYTYVRNCTVANSYLYAAGHCACIASYSGTSMSNDYTSDSTYGSSCVIDGSTYNKGSGNTLTATEIPEDFSDIEYIISNNLYHPAIFEDSYVIDSTVYDYGGTHSGTFISCTQGGLVCRRCFSNSTIYGNNQLGVFIGAIIGSGDGFLMDLDDDGDENTAAVQTRVNALFEDCYTSGTIEGVSRLGGFVGMIFDDFRQYNTNNRGIAVFKDCYSTSSVGMQYAGSDVGGFVGVVCGNVGTAMSKTSYYKSDVATSYTSGTASGRVNGYDRIVSTEISNDIVKDNAQDHLFINCYVAGEVGGITTSTTGGESTTIGAFVGEYRLDHAILYDCAMEFVNCYYDMQTTAMREKDIGDPGITSDTLNYYTITQKTAFSSGCEVYVDDDGYIYFLKGTDTTKYYFYNGNGATAEKLNIKSNNGSMASVALALALIDAGYYTGSGESIKDALYPTALCDSTKNTALNLSGDMELMNYTGVVTANSDTGTDFSYDDNWADNLTGVYTTGSTTNYKELSGLTYDSNDTTYSVSMEKGATSDTWLYVDEYYPILKAFLDPGENNFATYGYATGAADDPKKELVYNYTMASTATVLLDHYDTVLTMDGYTKEYEKLTPEELAALGGAEYQRLVYDTVRDITRSFTFTSTEYDYSTGTTITYGTLSSRVELISSTTGTETNYGHISWTTNDTLNTEEGFFSYLASTEDSTDFTLTYNDAVITDDGQGGNSYSDYTKTYNPAVLTIAVDTGTDIGEYKCYDFSCGKQWVTISYNRSDYLTSAAYETDPDDDGSYALSEISAVTTTYDNTGVRNLRLLPTAYINAGEMITVTINVDDSGSTESNTVDIGLPGSEKTVDSFDHTLGVAYAITDKDRMADTGITGAYPKHNLAEYTSTSSLGDDTSYFAFFAKYNMGESGSDEKLAQWVDEDFSSGYENMSSQTTTGELWGDDDGNGTTTVGGQTMVRVYKTTQVSTTVGETTIISLEMGDEIAIYDDQGNLTAAGEKWAGQKNFETDASGGDTGYYYMVYYWQLDDGRYLTDTKLVRITATTHYITLITGILEQERTDGATGDVTDIYQYVSVDSTYYGSQTPTDEENYDSLYVTNTSELEVFNEEQTYNDETYYCNTTTVSTSSGGAIVGWQRSTTDYTLTTLIIQAKGDTDSDWTDMAYVDAAQGVNLENGSEFEYNATTTVVMQNTELKTYTVSSTSSPHTFTTAAVTGTDTIQSYIRFAIGDTGQGAVDITDNLRVIALFTPNKVEIEANKYVYAGETEDINTLNSTWTSGVTYTGDDEYMGYGKYLTTYDAVRSIDDTDITEDEDRMAVLSGDTLTYRIEAYNIQTSTSQKATITDTVPEGCTLVEDSLAIYMQKKSTSNTNSSGATYGILHDVLEENKDNDSYSAVYEDSTGTITWTVPSIARGEIYYFEYQVTVDNISASTLVETLENTAEYEYMAGVYSDTGQQSVNTTATSVDTEDISGITTKTYTITISGFDTTKYSFTSIVDTLPDEFTLDTNTVEMTYTYTTASGDSGTVDLSGISYTREDPTDDSSRVTEFTISLENLKNSSQSSVTIDSTTTLTLVFSGTVTTNEMTNECTVNYKDTSGANEYVLTLYLGEGKTNQVETDVTHLYFEIEKVIYENDPAQTFLFEVAYTPEGGGDIEYSYVTINCTEQDIDSYGATIYTGSTIVQSDERGTYTITEVTDWSNTDYEKYSVTYTNLSTTGYTGVTLNEITTNEDDPSVTLTLPGLYFTASKTFQANVFPTALGSLETGTYATASFTDIISEYAYLSDQAYSYNIMQETQ